MRRLIVADAATEDLASIRVWLRQPGAGSRAARRLLQILTAIHELRTAPCLWPLGEHAGVRERAVEGYMVMYNVQPDTSDNATAGDVEIIRVFGPGQLRARL